MNLYNRIKRKQPGLLMRKPVFHHDNAWSHTASTPAAMLSGFKWDSIEQLAYNPDLAPTDFQIFSLLKKDLQGNQLFNGASLHFKIFSVPFLRVCCNCTAVFSLVPHGIHYPLYHYSLSLAAI